MVTKEQFIDRLEELSLLEDGWLNGEGKSLSIEGLQYIEKRFLSYLPDYLPYLYPNHDGGIRAEWNYDLFIDIDLSLYYRAHFYLLSKEICLYFELYNDNDWNALRHVLLKHHSIT